MRNLILLFVPLLGLLLSSCGAEPRPAESVSSTDITATIKTSAGDIEVKLYAAKTPVSVANFVNLAQRGYWDGSNFHRVVPGFVTQGGKHSSGVATPGYTIKNETYTENPEISDLKHHKSGMLSMARTSQLHTNGAQWYITHRATPSLDGGYTVFGEVTKGLDTAINMQQGAQIISVTITSDASALTNQLKDQIKTWNSILDKNFPDLKASAEEQK